MNTTIVLTVAGLAGAATLLGQMNAPAFLGQERSSAERVAQPDGGIAGGIGPDVIYTNIGSISNHGVIGGIRAYTLGSYTCNIGDQNLLWLNDGTPGLAMNAYRLHDGLLMQIGMSWVKHACCAAAGSGCGLPCNGQGGNVLGVGCRDIYSSGWNAGQGFLGPRSGINAFSGAFSGIPGGNGNAIFRRLQIVESELSSANYPGALYFAEGVYAATDDAQSANWLNNASYERVAISPGFVMSEAGPIQPTIPAIHAWRDHGNGVDTPDNTVQIVNADVPGEGRFIVGARAGDNGDGTWRYNYAVFNLNSHRSGGSFSVPVPSGVTVSNVGFHDVPYHSGEPYDNTDWTSSVDATSVTWLSPQTYAENPDSNALRWATMYSFWFDADAEPAEGEVTIGLFRPGTPVSVSAVVVAPGAQCLADINGDGDVDIVDLQLLLSDWGECQVPPDGCPADVDGDGSVGIMDLLTLLANWGTCP